MAHYKISFIGAGNVAGALCRALAGAGQHILSVSSAGGESARLMAEKYGAEWRHDCRIPEETDIVIIAVTDDSIAEVAGSVKLYGKTVMVHTAGSVPLGILGLPKNAGVLYPLQTFTKGYYPEMSKVPFFIEATDKKTMDMLHAIASLMSETVYECDSDHRRYLHLAAVFTNNFSNFMMSAGESIARKAGFDPAVLRPLIGETARKALLTGPHAAQTGPAKRDDSETMRNHIDLLSFSPEYQDLYRQISTMITDLYKKKE